jgi:hypothetical protein
MSEFRPILEDSPALPHARLLRSAALDVPPRGARARVLAGLGVPAVVVAEVGAAAAAQSAVAGAQSAGGVGISLVAKWVGAGVLAGTLATGSLEVVRRQAAPDASVEEVTERPSPASTDRSRAAAPSRPSTTRVEAGAERVMAAPAPATAAAPQRAALPAREQPAPARSSAVSVAPSSPGQKLAAEVATLDAARRALEQSDGSRALKELDGYQRNFSNPRLGPEAAILRIETLLRLKRYQDAERLGREFLALEPRSPHAERVRMLIAEAASAARR